MSICFFLRYGPQCRIHIFKYTERRSKTGSFQQLGETTRMQKLVPLCHGTIESLTAADDDESISRIARRRLASREAPADIISAALLSIQNYSRHTRAIYNVMEIVGELCTLSDGDLKFSCVNFYEFSSTLRAGDRRA